MSFSIKFFVVSILLFLALTSTVKESYSSAYKGYIKKEEDNKLEYFKVKIRLPVLDNLGSSKYLIYNNSSEEIYNTGSTVEITMNSVMDYQVAFISEIYSDGRESSKGVIFSVGRDEVNSKNVIVTSSHIAEGMVITAIKLMGSSIDEEVIIMNIIHDMPEFAEYISFINERIRKGIFNMVTISNIDIYSAPIKIIEKAITIYKEKNKNKPKDN